MTAAAGDDEWDDQPESGTDGQQGEPRFPDVQTWVGQWLAPVIRRHVNVKRPSRTLAWCPQWWRHAEAVDRLTACWRAWEGLRLDGTTGISTWWLQHFDPMWAQLTDAEDGPFAPCMRQGHLEELIPGPLPLDDAPDGWFGG